MARSRGGPGRGGGAVLAQAGGGGGDAGGGGGAAGGADTGAVEEVFVREKRDSIIKSQINRRLDCFWKRTVSDYREKYFCFPSSLLGCNLLFLCCNKIVNVTKAKPAVRQGRKVADPGRSQESRTAEGDRRQGRAR